VCAARVHVFLVFVAFFACSHPTRKMPNIIRAIRVTSRHLECVHHGPASRYVWNRLYMQFDHSSEQCYACVQITWCIDQTTHQAIRSPLRGQILARGLVLQSTHPRIQPLMLLIFHSNSLTSKLCGPADRSFDAAIVCNLNCRLSDDVFIAQVANAHSYLAVSCSSNVFTA
jgi:hypothetical protein